MEEQIPSSSENSRSRPYRENGYQRRNGGDEAPYRGETIPVGGVLEILPDYGVLRSEVEGILPRETVVIEDSAAGIEAGKKAGAQVIALKTNWYTRDQLFRADFIADDFAHILDLLRSEKTLDHSTG